MPTVYKSTDTSAPVLSGSVGALIGVLDGCLVNGYGSKTAAGWTKAFTGTNQADYLQGGSGVKKYFQIDDNGPGLGGAAEARLWGFETMTAYNTGTGQFPAAATIRAIRKSATASATARDWIVVADAKTCHYFILTGDTAGTYYAGSFGDLYSFAPGDLWKGYLCARDIENSATNGNEWFAHFRTNGLVSHTGLHLQRSYTGFGGTINGGCCGGDGEMAYLTNVNTSAAWTGALQFPNPPDGNLHLSIARIAQTFAVPAIMRGRYRGLYIGCHPIGSFNDQDNFTGTGEFAGKSFLIIKTVQSQSLNNSYVIVETSTWDESA